MFKRSLIAVLNYHICHSYNYFQVWKDAASIQGWLPFEVCVPVQYCLLIIQCECGKPSGRNILFWQHCAWSPRLQNSVDSAKGWRDCQPLVLHSQTAILVELEQNDGLTTHKASRPHHVQAITDGVPNILQLTRGVTCSLLYPGSGYSQSLALCLCNAALIAVYQTIIIEAFIQRQLPFCFSLH